MLAALQFGTFSLLVRTTEMEAFGLWVLVNALLSYSRAADFWSNGLTSFVGEARGRGKTDDAAGFVATAVLSGVVGYALLAVLGGTVIHVFAQPLASASHIELVREIVPLMALTFWLLAVAAVYQAGFLGFGRPALKATQTIGGAVLFFVLALWLAPRYGLWGILVAQALQATAMLAFGCLTFHGVVARTRRISWRRDQFYRLAQFGSRAIAVGAVQLAIEPVIRLLANHFGGLGVVVVIELASRIISVVRSVITAIGQIIVPEFARLWGSGAPELTALYCRVCRLFLLAGISGFGLLLSAAPAVEDVVFGKTGTGFVSFLCILAIGWLGNTVAAPAYFLLFSRLQMRPIFWANIIMTGGAITLGTIGGLLGGIHSALAGVAGSLAAAGGFLLSVSGMPGNAFKELFNLLRTKPERLLPLLSAGAALIAIDQSGVLQAKAITRGIAYAAAIIVTLSTALVFGDVRGIIRTASNLR